MGEIASGLLVLDKPAGLTSFRCLDRVKTLFGERHVGHGGTLDPLAEGVLLVLCGEATKHQASLVELEKQYWFRARWGIQTDSGDRDGKVLETRPFNGIGEAALREVLRAFVGPQNQTPPALSALKFRGKPYYYWTRRGIAVPRNPRPIEIYFLEYLGDNGSAWEARVCCSRGTYVRSLVQDIASRVGTVAMVESLVRERVGPYRREDAVPWAALEHYTPQKLREALRDPIGHYAGHL
jgi:tRNA pseudouridine55 synthase